ncbi:MAG: uridine kinase [Lachnospiraceae bacterium]|nr:uridine kinase [Lachnospiraceae bacterium]
MLDEKKICNSILKNLDKNITVIGIDGLGGAGKSTISEKICAELEDSDVHIILLHIDDFIHVREVRYNLAYPDWQCYYDLQWRYDYFIEIINKIKSGTDNHIRVELYDKDNDCYAVQCYDVIEKTVVIVEGIFLQRKELQGIFDYMVYIDIPEEIRMKRVLKRDTYIGNEQQIIDKYENRYFPAERKYVNEYRPNESADYVIGE